MMKRFKFSVIETWNREYVIEASNLDAAVKIWKTTRPPASDATWEELEGERLSECEEIAQ